MLLVWTPMYSYVHVSLCYSYVLVWCFSRDRSLQDLSLTTGFCYYFRESQQTEHENRQKNPGYITNTWMVLQGGGSEKEHPVH